MTKHINSFLKAVLGADAAGALAKAADRSDSLATVLGSRSIVGWLSLASRLGGYDGGIPGLDGSYLRFTKSQDHSFGGSIRLGKHSYDFDGVDLSHVAAAMTVALGEDQTPSEELRDADLAALGKNIDLLLKMQLVKSENEESSSSTSEESEELEKAAGTTAPGAAATQNPPAGPVGGGFTAPKAKQPVRAKKKGFSTKLTLSQASAPCSVCGSSQMRSDLFTGCECLRDLAKHASVDSVNAGGYTVTLDADFWTKEDVALLHDIVEGA